jgi:hypothetical protein
MSCGVLVTPGNKNISNEFQSEEGNPLSQTRDLREKVWRVAQVIFLTIEIFFDPIIDFFTQGLSDFLGLETLRHGTSIQNYISIRLNGADPMFGGGATGAVTGFGKESLRAEARGNFFVTKDSEAYVKPYGTLGSQIFNRCISSRFYCGLSAKTTISGTGFHKTLLRVLIITFNVMFVPTVKFRFILEDILGRFENDPDNKCSEDPNKGLAYRTKHLISTDYIGLKGIVTQGLQGNIWSRMKAHPIKVCWGLVKLINPIGIVMLLALGTYLLVRKSRNFLQGRIQIITTQSNYESPQRRLM